MFKMPHCLLTSANSIVNKLLSFLLLKMLGILKNLHSTCSHAEGQPVAQVDEDLTISEGGEMGLFSVTMLYFQNKSYLRDSSSDNTTLSMKNG